MPKLNDIRELAEEIAEEVSHSPNAWMNYLDTAARLYRYPFSDSLLIHAQRPDATACASMEVWNGKMRRWVKRGAKGIALIDDRGRRKRLRYVFDISDTRMVEGGRTPFLWQIQEDQREAIRKFLVEAYWLEGEGIESLPGALYALALEVTEEGLDEATAGLAYEDGERFQTMGKEAVREQFKTLLTESIFYVLARRCGLEPEAYIREGAFAGIEDFGSLSRLSFLGDATNKSAESILIWIRREMQKIYREEAETRKGNRQDEKKELEKEVQTAIQEGEKENEIDLSSGRGLSVPGSDHQGGRSRNREIRDVEGNVSEGTSEGMVSESSPFRETEPASGGSGKSRQGKDGSDDQRDIRKTSGSGQESRPDSMDSPYERDSRNGGGSRFARFGVSLREKADSQEKSDNQEKLDNQEKSVNQKKFDAQRETTKKFLSKAEEEKASVLLLSDLPEVEEQEHRIERKITQDEIDAFLINGSSFRDQNLQIYAYFLQEHSEKEKAEFLRKSYGTGGSSQAVLGIAGLHVHYDAKGLWLFRGKYTEPETESLIRWPVVARRIDYLIDEGHYLSEKERERMPEYEREYMAGRFLYFYRRIPQEVKESFVYLDFSVQAGNVEELAELLKDKESASGLVLGMQKALKALSLEFSDVQEMARFLNNFQQYLEGEYTIFSERTNFVHHEDLAAMDETLGSSSEEVDFAHREVSAKIAEEIIEPEIKAAEKIPVQQEAHQLSLFDFMDNNTSAMDANGQEMQTTGQEKRENTLDEKLFADNYPDNLASPDLTAGTEKINFRITDNDLGAGGPKQKFHANLEAIYLLKKLEAENRLALPKEQEILSRYVGWGGIPYAFDERNENWSAEYKKLKDILTPEEYQAARASTLNAFYTSPTVIKAMYEILGNMGLRSGNGLEPSCGIGNFMGLLPEGMEGVRMYGVELDGISGRIARQLYQKNSIVIQGFETTDYPDSFFDFVIGNVPFGNYKVSDPKYNRYNFMIHDYFIIKSLDLIRPGGVIAVVTSSGTLDKQKPSVRQYISNRADLLGAIRLPNNAFQRNANTSVVADILFFQKRDRAVIKQPDWINLGLTPEGYSINSYFVHHPEMILGELTTEHTQYGRQEVTVKPKEGISLKEQLKEAASHIHGEIEEVELMELADWEAEEKEESILADPSIKNFSFARVDGEVYYRENSRMRRMELPAVTKERVLGMIKLREITQELIQCQMDDGSDVQLAVLQQKLNQKYDSFTAHYGLISSNANRRAFSQDSSYCLLASLEYLDEEGKLERKADIFTKRTIRKARPVSHVDTSSEALAISISERAKVDLILMAKLAEKTEEELIADLTGVIFKNPITSQWETTDEYLSGNVREKLSIAREWTKTHPEFLINVQALENVQPKDLEASEIEVRLGATWIKTEYNKQFMAETFQTPAYLLGKAIQVRYAGVNGQWNILGKNEDSRGNSLITSTYGTARVNAYHLLENTLNLKDTLIYDTKTKDGKEKRVLNKKETMLASQKQEMIKEAFKEWIFKDLERREDLCRTYNTIFNSIRPREYDGIIIGHSQFEKIPLSAERQSAYMERQIQEIAMAIADAKMEEGTRFTIKQMEKTKKRLEERLGKLNSQARKDNVVTFEQLGVDHIFVDESHYYKNCYFFTKMRNVAGIAQTDAQKCSDLLMKCQYLDDVICCEL